MSGHAKANLVEPGNVVIDGPELARAGASLDGVVPVARLERLADALANRSGELSWRCSGRLDRDGKGRLSLKVSGQLALTCQRCLTGLEWPFELNAEYLLVPETEAWPEDDLENGECDAIPAAAAMSIWALVEDEVLLALPIAPRHEDCRLPEPAGNKEAASPFAALAGWKKH